MKPVERTLRVTLVALLGTVVILCPGDAATADGPPTLATIFPREASAFLEVDDLSRQLKRWQGSRLHRDFGDSVAARNLEKSRLYLRLQRNLAEVEEVAGFAIDLDRVTRAAGHRSAIALYELPTTSFVFATELTAEEARASTWLDQQGRMETREHRGIKYLLKEGARNKAPLAVALVGQRVVAGTDLNAFRGALVLAARAAGLAVQPPSAGQKIPVPLADEPAFRALRLSAPSSAPVQIWASKATLSGHYFDDYWIFGQGAASDIEAAWLTLTPGEEKTVETRLYLYADGKRPDVARDDGATLGAVDIDGRVQSLPSTALLAGARPVNAQGLAAAILELLPVRPRSDAEEKLAGSLTTLAPRSIVEIVDPTQAKTGPAEHHAGLIVALANPSRFDGEALERMIVNLVVTVPHMGDPPAFVADGEMRTLRLPLVADWALTWKRVGDALVLATDPATCQKLVAGMARPEAASLLAPQAPRLLRVDLERAGVLWRGATGELALRQNWRDPLDAEFFQKSIGGLFGVTRDARRIVAYGYARGASQYAEEVHFLAR